MAIEIDPESTIVSASNGTNWQTHVDAWHGWFNTGSAKWDVKNFTDNTNSTGHIGFTIQPSSNNLDFDLCIHYNDNNGGVSASIDPQASITNPLNPTGSGSPSASQELTGIFDPDPTYRHSSIVSATDETVSIVLRNTGSSINMTPAMFHGGDIYRPVFSNDSDFDITGLGYTAVDSSGSSDVMEVGGVNHTILNEDENRNNRSQIYLGGTTWDRGTVERDSTNYQNADLGSGRGRETPMPIPLWDRDSSTTHKFIGFMKYMYSWDTLESALDTIEGPDNEGYILLWENDTRNAHVMVPFDNTQDPKQKKT